MEVTRCSFKIHSFDADAFGLLTPPRLLGYLLESAGVSADALGFGVRELQTQGLTWVVGRVKIELDAPITHLDLIEVDTWPSGLERAVAFREFQITRHGQPIGRATSQWFVLDMKTRMPVRPQKLFPERLRQPTEHLVVIERAFPAMPQAPTTHSEFNVRRSDIDLNQHVTAASYIAWAMEALPESIWRDRRLSSLDVQFLEECLLGSRIVTQSQLSESDAVLHGIVRQSDGKELARLRSAWVERNTGTTPTGHG